MLPWSPGPSACNYVPLWYREEVLVFCFSISLIHSDPRDQGRKEPKTKQAYPKTRIGVKVIFENVFPEKKKKTVGVWESSMGNAWKPKMASEVLQRVTAAEPTGEQQCRSGLGVWRLSLHLSVIG